MQGPIQIGTSGYSYKHWRDDFYPAGVRAKDYLSYYAGHFKTVEINASFYRLPEEHTLEHWVAQVPDDFLFCPKMSRFLTHMKKLRDPEEPLRRFFGVFACKKDRLGPVLFQLPDKLHFKADVAEHFYKVLRRDYSDYKSVIEVRHETWLSQESLKMMREFRVGLVVNLSGVHWPYSEEVTSGDVYLQFQGPRELYASSYNDEELKVYARKMKAWMKKGLDVWAFFNNDIHGYAPRNAARLQELLTK